ncbi:hypothetical protein CGCS363_v007645 [Colletotrichum siamense]|uniref:uncharacterized protein n=1 Tax=Colletotrichum siamense TaxID=690259 RepID=UPI001872E6BD|nr:uncharacterized protein CGCS363_v007645 [Colletotrichum siamense]KAF5501535.1 hypothetical protein CGCS363_v007645 [Colletotrichum siamense]
MAQPLRQLDNLSAILDWRFSDAWEAYKQRNDELAQTLAAELLMEPRLSDYHQAGMHLILAGGTTDFVEHAKEAIRLYNVVIQHPDLKKDDKAFIRRMIEVSETALADARRDKVAHQREVDEYLANGNTMTSLHDAQIQAMNDRLDAMRPGDNDGQNDYENIAERNAIDEDSEDDKEKIGKEPEFAVPLPPMPKQTSSHNVSAAMPASSQSVPETVANSQVSDNNNMGRSQSTASTEVDPDHDIGFVSSEGSEH